MKVYTVEQVAEIVQLHRMTIYKYIDQGKLKANKIGKGWRITQKQLDEFIEGDNHE